MEWNELLTKERQKQKERIINYNKNLNASYIKWIDDSDYPNREFDDDYMTIISSQAFRKLQDKTQVFLLDRSDFVRTRLTHSFEVSTIAKQIASFIFYELQQTRPEKYRKILEENPEFEHQVETIVACAGLLHDTGNPPYGHYGEEVIRFWFKNKFKDPSFTWKGKPIGSLLTEQMKADFEYFEGNAQGLRIMSKSRLKDKQDYDINLTYSVMNTLVKYPNPSHRFDKKSEDLKLHKNGYYYAEKDIMDEMCQATGTKLADGTYTRHPLVYIMEAADDIAYATADLEDSVMKTAFSIDVFIKFYQEEVDRIVEESFESLIKNYEEDHERIEKIRKYQDLRNKMAQERRIYGKNDQESQERIAHMKSEREALFNDSEEDQKILEQINKITSEKNCASTPLWCLEKALQNHERSEEADFVLFENWLSECRNELIRVVAKTFVANYDAIMDGSFQYDLFKDSYRENSIKIMKKIMAHYVYDSAEIVDMELSAKRILERLLKNFTQAAIKYDEKGEYGPTIVEDRFLLKIPYNFKADYQGAKKRIEQDPNLTEEEKEVEKLYHKLLMVTDYISGMTDIFAANLYKTINGEMQ